MATETTEKPDSVSARNDQENQSSEQKNSASLSLSPANQKSTTSKGSKEPKRRYKTELKRKERVIQIRVEKEKKEEFRKALKRDGKRISSFFSEAIDNFINESKKPENKYLKHLTRTICQHCGDYECIRYHFMEAVCKYCQTYTTCNISRFCDFYVIPGDSRNPIKILCDIKKFRMPINDFFQNRGFPPKFCTKKDDHRIRKMIDQLKGK